jgi:CRISPR-associated endonuclease Csn1
MNYRIGIDVGTASVGLVCYALDSAGEPCDVPYHAVRIFSEPLLPAKSGGVGEPKKAARRLARLARRQHKRKARRLRDLANLSTVLGLDPKKIPSDKGQDIHITRAQAATTAVPLDKLVQIFLRISKRRGYSGGFRVKAEGKNKGEVESGISALKEKMDEAGVSTLGQYLLHRFNNGETLKLKEAGLYSSRELVQEEFNTIWEEQSKHHPILNQTYEGKPIKEIFFKAIFYQRPLRTPAPMVGHCPLEPSLRRAPQAQPIAQEFRIEKQIADLRWGVGRSTDPLTNSQRDIIRELLNDHAEVEFEKIYKALEKAGHPKPPSKWLNLSQGLRERLTGNKTSASFRRLKLREKWADLSQDDQARVINLLADMGSPEVFDAHGWNTSLVGEHGTPRKISTPVVDFINEFVDSGKFDRLSKMKFDSGRSAYSIKALKSITGLMRSDHIDEYQAITKLYPDFGKKKVSGLTELSPHKPTGNTVVDVALRQVRREVNTAIRVLGGAPTEVIVELSREMAAGKKRREEQTIAMRRNEKARRNAKEELDKYGASISSSGIFRYRLWDEQGQQWCPYCDKTISLAMALDGGETNFEHIIPRALTRIGKQRDFIVLAHSSCNDEKGKRTPWEAWGNGRDPDRWAIVEARAKKFEKNRSWGKARQLLVKEYEGETLNSEAITGFSERQFHESSWIAKLTAQWLRTVCTDVSVSRGMMTAYLRRIWRLETVIPEARYDANLPVYDIDNVAINSADFVTHKPYWEGDNKKRHTDRRIDKRIDHRHHLIDAMVIGLCTRGLYQKMARHYKAVTESKKKTPRLATPPPFTDLRDRALVLVKNANLTHRPDPWPAGPFFKKQPLSVAKHDGVDSFTQHKLLSSLAGATDSVETVRTRLKHILSSETRAIVEREFEKRVGRGLSPTEALAADIVFPGFNTRIRRLKLRVDGDVSRGVRVGHTQRDGTRLEKWLVHDEYAWLEMDCTEPKKPEFHLVTLHEAAANGHKAPVHPIRVFKKSDTVRDSKDGRFFVIRQIKEQGPSLFLSLPTETRVVAKLTSKTGRRVISGKQLARLEFVSDV